MLYTIKTYIITNFSRKLIEFHILNSENDKHLFLSIKKHLKKLGYDTETTCFTSIDNHVLSEDNISNFIKNNELEIKLIHIVTPQNAKEFTRLNGLVYFFHTNENQHEHSPHIHVKYAEDEISIYLKDFCVIGKLKNNKKEKEAIRFVKHNIDKINNEWNKIIK